MTVRRNRAAGSLSPALALQLNAAIADHKAGRMDRAEALYRKVLSTLPKQPDALHLLGVIAGTKGQHEEAVRLIRQAIKSAPTLRGAHGNLAQALENLGRIEEAILHYRKAVKLDSVSFVLQRALNRCLFRVGDM